MIGGIKMAVVIFIIYMFIGIKYSSLNMYSLYSPTEEFTAKWA